MKLKNFYNEALSFVKDNKSLIVNHAQAVKESKDYYDFNTRLAFDCFYAHRNKASQKAFKAGNFDFDFNERMGRICGLDKEDILDSYISTLYKQVLIDCDILEK